MAFLHGVEVLESDSGARPVQEANASIIYICGTAPDADVDLFPLETPVLINGDLKLVAALDPGGKGAGSLYRALKGIYDQAKSIVIVSRVEEGADAAATAVAVAGDSILRTGVYSALNAQSVTGYEPKLILTTGFSDVPAVSAASYSVAEQLSAILIRDSENGTIAEAEAGAALYAERAYSLHPWLQVSDGSGGIIDEPASARVAGLIVKMDTTEGFWNSPSNHTINGVLGLSQPVSWSLSDPVSDANMMNEKGLATFIKASGIRLWGNRTNAADPKWMFLAHRRIADIVNESIKQSHLWAVDKNISKGYLDAVVDGVNDYGRGLVAKGALLGFKCWVDFDLTTDSALANGEVYFDYEFTPCPISEHITFTSIKSNYYLNVLQGE
ncbi:hypothetical protein EDC56_1255 [Sinobacterium caligoides]|uniref:Tail sheath protein subtilisin-like domain-containing protein n=1 Tax=Sinobacterium caligoides TaxID=933926 RepID=A0A3N2E0U0_9GAMM|nr:phage tail sheath C-terminal domain-containing protein [Sinobacterium caligoides]ROS05706.1 hypothetical protein EDC56_1255 [Sinobacterium caligoides]